MYRCTKLSVIYLFLVLYCLSFRCTCILITFGIVGGRNQKKRAWSLHCKENAIAELATVEKECTFLRLQYKLVQVTLEPWVQYTAKWEMHISTCRTMRRPWSITDMTWTLRSKCLIKKLSFAYIMTTNTASLLRKSFFSCCPRMPVITCTISSIENM